MAEIKSHASSIVDVVPVADVLPAGAAHGVDSARRRALEEWLKPEISLPDVDADFHSSFIAGASHKVEIIVPFDDIHTRGLQGLMELSLETWRRVPDISDQVMEVSWGAHFAEYTTHAAGTVISPDEPVEKVDRILVGAVAFDEEGLILKEILLPRVDTLEERITAEISQILAEHAGMLVYVPHGSRMLQKVIEETPSVGMDIVRQLQGQLLTAALDPHANHVLQKCIVNLSAKANQAIVDDFCGQVVLLARHRHAGRVLERLLEHCPHQQVEPLVDELLENPVPFFYEPYGNFVLQRLLSHGNATSKTRVATAICSEAGYLARHHVANNVVRKAFVCCTPQDCERMEMAIVPNAQE